MKDETPNLPDRIAQAMQEREYLKLMPDRNINGFKDQKLVNRKAANSNRITNFIRMHKAQQEAKNELQAKVTYGKFKE